MASKILYYAALGKNKKIKKLLNEGIDVNATNHLGESPLYCAVKQKQISTVKLLLKRGADTMKTPTNGESPLMAAAMNNNDKIVKMLLKHGAYCVGNNPIFTDEEERIIEEMQNFEQVFNKEKFTFNFDNFKPVYRDSEDFCVKRCRLGEGYYVTLKSRQIDKNDPNSNLILKEAQMLRSLQHTHIVKFIELLPPTPSDQTLVLETTASNNLEEKLHKERIKFTGEEILKTAKEITLAVIFLHRENIAHNFLNSSSIFFTDYKSVKLSNFEYACVINDSISNIMTANDKMLQYLYMAPELLNNGTATVLTDIYSFGCLLWEILSKKYPWAWLDHEEVQIISKVNSKIELPLQKCWPTILKNILILSTCRSSEGRLDSFENVLCELNNIKNSSNELAYLSCSGNSLKNKSSCVSGERFAHVQNNTESIASQHSNEGRSRFNLTNKSCSIPNTCSSSHASIIKNILSSVKQDSNPDNKMSRKGLSKRMIEISPSALHTFQVENSISKDSMAPIQKVHHLYNIATRYEREKWCKQACSIRELEDFLINLRKKGENQENIKQAIKDYFEFDITSRHVLPVRNTVSVDKQEKDEHRKISSHIFCKIFNLNEPHNQKEWAKSSLFRRDSIGRRIY